jgi:FMN-dependent oxidoreductase (nitrilotriacetate monooxygenase family)
MMMGKIGRVWRRPGSRAEEALSPEFGAELARWAEDAKIHALFIADHVALNTRELAEPPFLQLEPLTFFSALAARTSRIGLVASVSTTFSEPFNVARQLASLDHLSGGRAGWNVVTSHLGEWNFGMRLPGHAERYERAAEYAEVALKLWDSWEDGAIVADRSRRLYVDPSMVHSIDHAGSHFRVAGPLNVPRSPQGRPVLAQAGSSEDGRAFGARIGELIFTAQPTLPEARAFYSDMKSRARAYGRDPAHLKICPGVRIIVGATDKEADNLLKELNSYIDWETGRQRVAHLLGGADLSGIELTDRIPAERLPDPANVSGHQSRAQQYWDLATKDRVTLAELIEIEVNTSGHWLLAGSPGKVADQMGAWFADGGADGFVLMPAYPVEGFRAITDLLVPALQERGIFHDDYQGATLRENLALPRPERCQFPGTAPVTQTIGG